MQHPEAAGVLNGEGHSPLHLGFKHDADDRTIMGLLNHGPELACQVDRKSGLLPIHARLDGFPAASDLMRLYTTTGGCGEHTQQSSGGDNVISVNR